MSLTIERYLQGKLAPDEERAFEEHYLSDNELLDELILAEKLKLGLQGLAPTETAETDGRAWRHFRIAPQYAAAASLLLVVSLGFSTALYLENLDLRGANSTFVAQAPTRLVPLMAVRGSADPQIAAPLPGEWTVLLVDPGFTSYDSFDLVLTRASETGNVSIVELEKISPSYQDQLAIGLPGELLGPGSYRVAMRGRSGAGESEDAGALTFRVADRP